MAKRKSVVEEVVAEEPAPVVAPEVNPYEVAVKACIKKLDPTGKGHVPSGSPGVLQDVLETLNGAVAGE